MMMGGRAFVDTNILLRAMIPAFDQHQEAEALIQRMWANEVELWISPQVIREYLVRATHEHSFSTPLTTQQVISQVEVIRSLFRVADETPAVITHLLTLLQSYPTRGKRIHDANLVATMLANDLDTLLTLNIADFERFGDKITIISLDDPLALKETHP